MSQMVKGSFEVKLAPISNEQDGLSRMSIKKQYRGPLEATGSGQMMMGGVEKNGARVYVALETVTGKLDGRDGSFILVHRGTMTSSAQDLSVLVVPDSGTGELAGLSGAMTIDIIDGNHFYALTYEL